MSTFAVAMDRDANRQVISSNEAFKLESTWTFAAATTGSQATHTLFTVTGNVMVNIFGYVDTDLTGTGTLAVGVSGNTTGIITTTTGTDLTAGKQFIDATPNVIELLPTPKLIQSNIILTIGTNTITAGVIDFYCLWRPLSSDGNITVTTPA